MNDYIQSIAKFMDKSGREDKEYIKKQLCFSNIGSEMKSFGKKQEIYRK